MNLLIVEDELIVAENIAEIVVANKNYNVIGIAATAAKALAYVKDTPDIDLIICDITLKGKINGIELMKKISHVNSAIPFFYLTALADKQTVLDASSTNPSAYLVKPFTERQLLATIELTLLSFSQTKVLDENGVESKPTKRQMQVLKLLASGKTSKKMADDLNISDLTVQTHRRNLLSRFKVNSMNELIAIALKKKWI